MSVIVQSFESASHAAEFSGVNNLPAGLWGVAVTSAVLAAENLIHRNAKKEVGMAISDVDSFDRILAPTIKEAERRRMLPVYAATLMVGLAATSYAIGPTYETTSVNTDAHTIVVQDRSISMDYTKDVDGKSRTESVDAAINSATSYKGYLAAMQFGQDHKLVIRTSNDWQADLEQLTANQVDATGNNLVDALDDAERELPLSHRGTKEGRTGTIITVTDGGLNDSKEALADEVTKLKADGVELTVVEVGKDKSTYQLSPGAQPIPSGVDSSTFNGMSQENITRAQTATDVTKAVHAELKNAGNIRHEYPWYFPTAAFGAAALLSSIWLVSRSVRKLA
jgi:hypothetical protein